MLSWHHEAMSHKTCKGIALLCSDAENIKTGFQGWFQPNSEGDVAVIATLLVRFPRRTSASLGQRRAIGPDTERGLM